VIGSLTLIGLLFLGCKDFIALTPETYVSLRQQSADELRLYKHAREIAKNNVRVDYFFSDSPEYALRYGDDFAGQTFGPLLARMYPNVLFFNVFNCRFETFTEFLDPDAELKKYDHLYFLGNRNCFPKADKLDPATFETIDHAGDYYLQKWTRK
jgi:hypothetical protein